MTNYARSAEALQRRHAQLGFLSSNLTFPSLPSQGVETASSRSSLILRSHMLVNRALTFIMIWRQVQE